jgi:hypothetical protein
MNAGWVASRIEASRRLEALPFAHHAEVAALEPADQDQLLDLAEHNAWTSSQLRAAAQVAVKVSCMPCLKWTTGGVPDFVSTTLQNIT